MNLAHVLLFAADWEQLISFGVGLVFLLVWLVNQISDAKRKRTAGQMPPPKPPPRAEAAAAEADPLRKQIDEFLRRANQQPQGAGNQPRPAQAAGRQGAGDEVVVLLDEAPPRSRRSAPAPMLQPAVPDAQSAQRPRQQKRPKALSRGQSVAEHVAQRIGASKEQFNQEVANLGARVIEADKQFDSQLQQKFDHQLGSLSGRPTATAYEQQPAGPPTPAAQIGAMLASPEGIRQAIILNEILRRPEDRW